MITRNGIYNNLRDSSYIYKENDYIFVFSSKLYLDKFKTKLVANRVKVKQRFLNFHGLFIENIVADIILYKDIEKRGFLIKYGGSELCERVVLSLDRRTLKN